MLTSERLVCPCPRIQFIAAMHGDNCSISLCLPLSRQLTIGLMAFLNGLVMGSH